MIGNLTKKAVIVPPLEKEAERPNVRNSNL